MSANEWLQVVSKELKSKQDKIPKGFYSRIQIEEMLGLRKSAVGRIIGDLIKNKKIEMKNFRVVRDSGVFMIPHYKMIK